MRVLASAVFALLPVLAGATSVAPATAAETPSIEQIEARLAASRAQLNALYDRAAASGQQYNGALQDLAQADRSLDRERKSARRARVALADQSAAIAALTVQQLQASTGIAPVLTTLGQGDPRDVLARASAFDSAAEAMTARMDDLAARKAVHRVTQRRLERAREEQQRAVTEAAGARAAINAALAASKRSTLAAEAERTRLMQQVAAARAATAPPAAAPIPPSQPATPTQPVAPASPAAPVPAPPPAGGDVSPDDDSVWDRIARCESGGRWNINTGNGYYGGLQFAERTWRGIGGPGLPHEHSREVQIHYAKLLQKRYGWGQWECAWARFT